MVPLIAAFALLALIAAPTGTAASNSFATLVMTGFPASDGTPTEVKAQTTFKPGSGGENAYRYLVLYRTSSQYVTISLDSARLATDEPATIERHEKGTSGAESRMWIRGSNGTTLVFEGAATASANGRFHIGVLLIPFDEAWKQVKNRNGTPLQIYEWTLLSGIGVDHGPLFVGSGNVPGYGGVAVAVALAFAAWSRRAAAGNS